DLTITSSVQTLSGWFALARRGGTHALRVNDVELTWVKVPRPDVEVFLDAQHVHGFRALVDLEQLWRSGNRVRESLRLELVVDGRVARTRELHVTADVANDPQVMA